MEIFTQLALLFGFAFAGDCLARWLPWGLPASVWGLLLLFAALHSGLLKARHMEKVGGFLTANMAIFFLPPAVGILESYDMLHPVLFRLLFICAVTTILTFLAAYYTALFVARRRKS